MNKKEFLSRPKYRRLPLKEKERRWRQYLLTQSSKARVKPGKSYKQALVQRPRQPPKKPQPMKKVSGKSRGGSQTDKSFGLTRGIRLRMTGGKIIAWQPLPMYKGPQGSLIFPMMFQTMVTSISPDGAGNVGYVLQITGSIWSQIGIEATRFKRCRLRQCAFELLPKVGYNTNGSAIQLFNYSGDNTALTGAAGMTTASKVEQSVPDVLPFKAHFFVWRAQDNKDSEFVAATSTVVFNPTGHYFKLAGSGFPASNALWDLYAYCVVDFTETVA